MYKDKKKVASQPRNERKNGRARPAVAHFRPYLCPDATIYASVARFPGYLCPEATISADVAHFPGYLCPLSLLISLRGYFWGRSRLFVG